MEYAIRKDIWRSPTNLIFVIEYGENAHEEVQNYYSIVTPMTS
jgi:hypothetical protein